MSAKTTRSVSQQRRARRRKIEHKQEQRANDDLTYHPDTVFLLKYVDVITGCIRHQYWNQLIQVPEWTGLCHLGRDNKTKRLYLRLPVYDPISSISYNYLKAIFGEDVGIEIDPPLLQL